MELLSIAHYACMAMVPGQLGNGLELSVGSCASMMLPRLDAPAQILAPSKWGCCYSP